MFNIFLNAVSCLKQSLLVTVSTSSDEGLMTSNLFLIHNKVFSSAWVQYSNY